MKHDGSLSVNDYSLDARGSAGKVARAEGVPRGPISRDIPHVGGSKRPSSTHNTGSAEKPTCSDTALGIEIA